MKWSDIKRKIAYFVVPIVLFFSTEVNISHKDRLNYFVECLSKSSFALFMYILLCGWYEENKVFSLALSGVFFTNLIVGIIYHIKMKTFDIQEMLTKNLVILFIVSAVYFLLTALSIPLSDNIVGMGFKMVIQFISILYPASKALKNIFILSDGKHPPIFVMKALYNYEKDGKLKDFFETINNGVKDENN